MFGPILGGALASPAKKFPDIFGDSEFFKRYPFALPNIVASTLFITGIITGILFLKVNKRPFTTYITIIVQNNVLSTLYRKQWQPRRTTEITVY